MYRLFIDVQGYCIDNLNRIKSLIQNFLDKAMPPDLEPIKRHFKEKVWEELMQVVWSPKGMKYWMHELDALDEIEL
jgi:hypothetical protein